MAKNSKTMNATVHNDETGHDIKISSALTYDENSQVYKAAKAIIDKHANKATKEERLKNPFIEEYGKYKLNAFPKANVKPEDVKVNLEGDIDTHAVLTWKDPDTGRTVSAYTKKFMANNAKIKWKRIQKIDDSKVEDIVDKSSKLLKKGDEQEKDSAAMILIIAKTGLRPGGQRGFADTGNRGVSTLSAKNLTIDGDTIKINFRGKSYQDNNAEFKDAELAKYLEKRIEERGEEEFLFNANAGDLSRTFKRMTKNFKVKDLRTYTATKMAADILMSDEGPPPPLPEKQSQIKKMIKEKLKDVFEKVSQRLNNSPAMAKNSYIHPEIIKRWLTKVGVEPSLMESKSSMSIFEIYKQIREEKEIDDSVFDDVDQYNLPDWWDDDSISLVPIKKKKNG